MRRTLAALAVGTATALVPALVPAQAAAMPSTPSVPGARSGRPETPQVAPRRTVLHEGEPMVFAGRAKPGSTVRVSAVLDQGWEFLTAATLVRRPGVVRLSAALPRAGRYLVRADVVSPDRSTRYGFGPYVVTVAARGTRLPTYTTYTLAELLRAGGVSSTATGGTTVQVGGQPFHAEASFPAAAAPQWTAGIVAPELGCIRADVHFAVADGARTDSLSARVVNPWIGRRGQVLLRPRETDSIWTLLDGKGFSIEATGGATVHVRGTVTCPRGALAR